eukprot:1161373-Pelagomonas_calceolata.AAC.9
MQSASESVPMSMACAPACWLPPPASSVKGVCGPGRTLVPSPVAKRGECARGASPVPRAGGHVCSMLPCSGMRIHKPLCILWAADFLMHAWSSEKLECLSEMATVQEIEFDVRGKDMCAMAPRKGGVGRPASRPK